MVTLELGKNLCQLVVFLGVIGLTAYGLHVGNGIVIATGAVGGLAGLFLDKVKF